MSNRLVRQINVEYWYPQAVQQTDLNSPMFQVRVKDWKKLNNEYICIPIKLFFKTDHTVFGLLANAIYIYCNITKNLQTFQGLFKFCFFFGTCKFLIETN